MNLKKKLPRILLAVAVAFGLWLYVITVENPEHTVTYTDIPVAFQNESMLLEERNLMVMTEDVPSITLTLKGNRSYLNRLSNANITAVVDLSQVYEAGHQELDVRINYPSDVPGSSLEVVSQSHSAITLTFEKRENKPVPVQIVYIGEMPDVEEYRVDTANVELSSTEVNIKGPSSVISQITQARIEVDLTGKTASFVDTYRYALCDAEGEAVDARDVVTDTGEIEIKLRIHRIMELPLGLTVVDGGGATEETSLITIEPRTIKVSASETVLAELPDVLPIGTVNLAELTKDTELKFTINLPDNVTNLSGVTEVIVTIRFPTLSVKTLTITDIQAVGVPEGMEVELRTEALTVTVRGPRDLMSRLTEENVRAEVDFSTAQAGSTFKAEIRFSEEFSEVGAMGSSYVDAVLRSTAEGDEA